MIVLVFQQYPELEPLELISINAVQAFLKLQIDGGAEFKSFEISSGPFATDAYSVRECLAALSFLRIDGSIVYIYVREW
jgi:hypothetical protein